MTLYTVLNTSISRGVKVEADSPERAMDSVCYYRDWRRVECRVIETDPQIKTLKQQEES